MNSYLQAELKIHPDYPDYYATIVPLNHSLRSILKKDSPDELKEYLNCHKHGMTLLNSLLFKACKQGKMKICCYLIEAKHISPMTPVVQSGFRFSGPIFKIAAESGNLALIQYLVENHSVDIESKGLGYKSQDTALCRAAKKGHTSIAAYLLSHGANPNPRLSRYKGILDLAISFGKLEVVKLLVGAGTKIKRYDFCNALSKGHLNIVQYFLEKKPNIKSYPYRYGSPATLAIASGNVELVKYLEEKESLDIFERYTYKPNPKYDRTVCYPDRDIFRGLLCAGAHSGKMSMMIFLLEEKKIVFAPEYIYPVLYELLKNYGCEEELLERVKIFDFLIEKKYLHLSRKELNFLVFNKGYTNHIVCAFLTKFLIDPLTEKNKKILSITSKVATCGLSSLTIIELFRLFCFNLKIKENEDEWDLNFEDAVDRYINKSPISNTQFKKLAFEDLQFRTDALFYYCHADYKYPNVALKKIKMLIDLGLSVNTENDRGETVLQSIFQGDYSSDKYNIINFLIKNDADIYRKNDEGKLIVDCLTEYFRYKNLHPNNLLKKVILSVVPYKQELTLSIEINSIPNIIFKYYDYFMSLGYICHISIFYRFSILSVKLKSVEIFEKDCLDIFYKMEKETIGKARISQYQREWVYQQYLSWKKQLEKFNINLYSIPRAMLNDTSPISTKSYSRMQGIKEAKLQEKMNRYLEKQYLKSIGLFSLSKPPLEQDEKSKDPEFLEKKSIYNERPQFNAVQRRR